MLYIMSDHVTFFFYVVKDYVHSSFMDWTGKTVTWCVLLLSPEYYKNMHLQISFSAITNLELLFIYLYLLSMPLLTRASQIWQQCHEGDASESFSLSKKYPNIQRNITNWTNPMMGAKSTPKPVTKSGKIFSAHINKKYYYSYNICLQDHFFLYLSFIKSKRVTVVHMMMAKPHKLVPFYATLLDACSFSI